MPKSGLTPPSTLTFSPGDNSEETTPTTSAPVGSDITAPNAISNPNANSVTPSKHLWQKTDMSTRRLPIPYVSLPRSGISYVELDSNQSIKHISYAFWEVQIYSIWIWLYESLFAQFINKKPNDECSSSGLIFG